MKALTDRYAKDFIKRLFENDLAIIVLDSLDEVPDTNRSQVVSEIRKFETLFPNVSIIISCRTADYEENLENFKEVEVTRLSRDAITKIIKGWFIKEPEKSKRLLKLIDGDDGVASLTETPLLLSLLCIQFRHDLLLPKRKVELYQRCIDTLLRDWDASRNFRRESAYDNMSDDRKERLFEHIAGGFFIKSTSYEFPKKELLVEVGDVINKIGIDQSKAEDLLTEIESHHGILERYSQDNYCFSHTSIQDFFVARYLISKRGEF